ncbi:MAG: ribose 5-phosphate isomerase A, partial [Pseudomonadales bacterium]|nr:ribose 5-phosphate isomerase A [Pseudomonadales bacterium]
MTSQNTFKRQVAQAALDLIRPKLTSKSIIGVGTGSTTDFFIDELANIRHLF